MNDPSDVRTRGVGRLRRISAVFLSLVMPGAGHFLLGAFRRGIAWAVGLTLLGPLLLFAAPISVTIVTGLVAVIVGRVASAIDAAATLRPRPPWKVVVAAWIGLLVCRSAVSGAVMAPLASYYTAHYAQAFAISTGGMQPTLLVGDSIMVDKSAYRVRAPQRNDIVVFLYPRDESRDFVKRIIALPGEVVVVQGRGVLVNGKALVEPYVEPPAAPPVPTSIYCGYAYGCEPTSVPADSYFVMGDNRDNSEDSRYWGFVKREQIKGKAHVIHWSWDLVGSRLRTDRIGRLL